MKNELERLNSLIKHPGLSQEATKYLLALSHIAALVNDELDGDPDAPLNAGNVTEVVCDALQSCGLWPAAKQEHAPEWEQFASIARGLIAQSDHAILAFFPNDPGRAPITLALGGRMDRETRAGAVLAWLLASDCQGAWIVYLRPGAVKVAKREAEAAARIMAAGRLVDFQPSGVVLVTPKGHQLIEAAIP